MAPKVTSVSGAIHQSFKTYREAYQFWYAGTKELLDSGLLPAGLREPPVVRKDGGPGGTGTQTPKEDGVSFPRSPGTLLPNPEIHLRYRTAL